MATEFSSKVMQKALHARPWVRKVAPNKYRVTPRTADHGKYELTVSYDAEGFPLVGSCIDYRTDEECLGFKYSEGNCYHAARLIIHLMPRTQRKEAA